MLILHNRIRYCLVLAAGALACVSQARAQGSAPTQPGTAQVQGAGATALPGAKGSAPATSQAGQAASQSAAVKSASGKQSKVSPLAPSVPPARPFARPRIGLALGGGGALALSEVGVLQWFEEHHIPVDMIAGTSMGCMVSALYSTGRTPAELKDVMNDRVFASVFSFSQAYSSRSFRRREDSREIPNGIDVGLKHGVSLRNAVLVDQGLNAFLDRQFLRYDDQTDFNQLPIPLRCVSTDITDAQVATFARGSIPDAIRASVSLPGVYQPFEMDGHEYVDGGVLDNLPTSSIKDMQADVVLAVSLPLQPAPASDLNSILGVLQRSFSVAIEGAERSQRKLANVVILPDLKGFTANDYLKTAELSKRGYAAAEASKEQLLPYSLSDADWQAYLVHRASLRRGPAGPVLRVRVDAPSESATRAVERLFAPLVNQPVDTRRIEALLDQIRSDGRYEVDYTVGYETAGQFAAQTAGKAPVAPDAVNVPVATTVAPGMAPSSTAPQTPNGPIPKAGGAPTSNQPGVAPEKGSAATGSGETKAQLSDNPDAKGSAATKAVSDQSLSDIDARPIILVNVTEKKTGPPFLRLGVNLEAQAGGITRATAEGIITDQDLGGYGNELRSYFKLGYLTDLGTEYYRPFNAVSSDRVIFVAPRGEILREPFPIYTNQTRVAERQLQRLSVGADVGLTNSRTQELRAGFDYESIRWDLQIGQDGLPSYAGPAERARLQYSFDTQDRALVPRFGVHAVAEAAYLFSAVGSPDAPELSANGSFAHQFRLPGEEVPVDPATGLPKTNSAKQVAIFAAEGGTYFGRDVAQPFRFTLGGPFRLSAAAIDEYRGTEYFYLNPALLRRIAQLPAPLGQSIFVGAAYEYGRIYNPNVPTVSEQDVFFGVIAETPLGLISVAPAIGTDGHRKFVFTLGKVF